MTVNAATPIASIESTDAAPMIGVNAATLKSWRRKGIGPPYVRFGNRVRYRLCDIEAWLDAHTVTPGKAAAQGD
jgi:predicted site-specific integrase-resolvase